MNVLCSCFWIYRADQERSERDQLQSQSDHRDVASQLYSIDVRIPAALLRGPDRDADGLYDQAANVDQDEEDGDELGREAAALLRDVADASDLSDRPVDGGLEDVWRKDDQALHRHVPRIQRRGPSRVDHPDQRDVPSAFCQRGEDQEPRIPRVGVPRDEHLEGDDDCGRQKEGRGCVGER